MSVDIAARNAKTDVTFFGSKNLIKGQSVWKKIRLNKVSRRQKQIHSLSTLKKVLLLRKKTINLKSNNPI